MITLKNSQLLVSILDPEQDQSHFGSRYCTGGYIWQVEDSKYGALLSGPEYPGKPSVFNGQGAPEVFEIALGQDSAGMGEDVYVLGVGLVRRESPVKPFHVRNNFTVTEFSKWNITVQTESELSMTSLIQFKDWNFQLEKSVQLEGRKVISKSKVQNFGSKEIPLRWFAHPFFPIVSELSCVKFSVEADLIRYLPSAGGFDFNDNGELIRIENFVWKKGCFQLLNLPFGSPMEFYPKHPLLGNIQVKCLFPLAWMPVWSNDLTLSLEPYHHTVVLANAISEWSIHYQF